MLKEESKWKAERRIAEELWYKQEKRKQAAKDA